MSKLRTGMAGLATVMIMAGIGLEGVDFARTLLESVAHIDPSDSNNVAMYVSRELNEYRESGVSYKIARYGRYRALIFMQKAAK